jgi:hypothetical protein
MLKIFSMTNFRLTLSWMIVAFPLMMNAQGNPFLKKYAGAYHLMAFGEETPTLATEKILVTLDGKWTSTSLPVDNNGVVSKIQLKKTGTWKASEGLIQLSFLDEGIATVTDFKLDDGLFMSSSTFLKKIVISNPLFINKYSGSYNLIESGEEEPVDITEVISFKPDGKVIFNKNGAKDPKIEPGTWKANEDIIQMNFKEDDQDAMWEFNLKNGAFVAKNGMYLRKVVPPAPVVNYLPRHAGTYHMLADGQTVTPKTDKYVFTPDGNCTWTYFPDGVAPVINKGTWKASERLIQMYFEMGDFDKGDGLPTDFKLDNGVFRNGSIFLKKVAPKIPVKK